MKTNITAEKRGNLEAEMTTVFSEKIKGLPKELQEILIDDMVTAFESRLAVFRRLTAEDKGNSS